MSLSNEVPFSFILSTIAVIVVVTAVGISIVKSHPKAKSKENK